MLKMHLAFIEFIQMQIKCFMYEWSSGVESSNKEKGSVTFCVS